MNKIGCDLFIDYKKYFLLSNKDELYCVLFAKVKGGYIIGPLVDKNFNHCDFLKRLSSSKVHLISEYREVSKRKKNQLYKKYWQCLQPNLILEIRKKEVIEHFFYEIG